MIWASWCGIIRFTKVAKDSDVVEEMHLAVSGVKSSGLWLVIIWNFAEAPIWITHTDVLNESLSLINYFSNAFIESLKIQRGHLRASSFTEFYERNYIL